MIERLLGFIDVFLGIFLLIVPILPWNIAVAAGIYLLLKGGAFAYTHKRKSDYIDVAIGFYALLMAFGVSFLFVTVIASLFLIIKGLYAIL